MKERPIIFTGESLHAILAGRKTQTRRVVKLQENLLRCSPFQVGMKLWVRETYANIQEGDLLNQSIAHFYYGRFAAYRADCGIEVLKLGGNFTPQKRDFKWRSPLFMPRSASRITLEIVAVRVERLQDISESDAVAEGLETMTPPDTSKRFLAPECGEKPPEWEGDSRIAFMWLWDSINAKRGFGWDLNPLVWVVEFKNVS